MKTSKFDDSEQSVGLVFWRVSVLWQRKVKEALNKIGITHTQFVILATIQELSEHDMTATQKEISDFSSIDVMTVSSVLRLLEKNNYITRKPHPKDTRANVIIITPKGTEAIYAAIPAVENVDDNFFFEDIEKNRLFLELLTELRKDNEKI
ncbi:transcriptional regulator SlyA [Sebaldella termitidis]|jgi:DNA-binding MarR family transcriptional regulator|uniref:Transcriptional regulator, MarR family n=1 Tax=Sebaldella termitidis (strain ATCC 33386 / NCTC 11300) TaxID=526218 RepID=D1AQ71_SEBTE|nr:MarR family transcriptional regulator [Sebaldella termitidis]ACZ07649.1 transcriptional regulator, MarR family [Sebaldella termitidis ATCC 33386]MBP7979602.1 MarR family transcriptional regulator [Sebaldella sp.]SUI22946.1 transcriptional regulator SlyA [Sebaldella termitidis]